MNDDDLEERLAKWQLADPPADFMRRLRAVEPPRSNWLFALRVLRGDLWSWNPAAGSGLLAVVALVLTVWPGTRHHSPETAEQPAIKRDNHGVADSPVLSHQNSQWDLRLPNDRMFIKRLNHDSILDLSSFTQPSLQFAALENGRNKDVFNGLPLDSPAGPMRLDCGYALPVNELGNYPFGRFHLNAGDRF